jgi:putative proteasome-type protease
MMIYEKPGDRFMVMLSAGNLSVSQSIRELLQVETITAGPDEEPMTIWNATSMFDVPRILGATVPRVYGRRSIAAKCRR